MMTKEQALELGKRALAAGWNMMAGALIRDSKHNCDIRIQTVYDDVILYSGAYGEEMDVDEAKKNFWPDFRDPATLGILLAQVRERWGDATIHAQFYEETWRVAYWNPENFFWAYWPEGSFVTETEALVACLEAAKEGKL